MHPPPLENKSLWHGLTVALLVWAGQAAAFPTPFSDVDWSDSAPDWSDSTYRWSGTDLIPYVAYSRMEIGAMGGQVVFAVRSARWTGSAWSRQIVVTNLIAPPDAVVALRTVGGNTELVHALHHDDGNPVLAWLPWNVVTGVVGLKRVHNVAKKLGRPALAIRATEGDPAFAFERDDPIQGGTWFVRWNEGAQAFTDLEQVQACRGGHPSLALDPQNDDRWRITCLDPVNINRTDVKYVFKDANGNQVPEQVFVGQGCPAPTVWAVPDMAFVDGEPVVAAHEATQNEVWFSRRQGPNTWACAQIANAALVFDLSIAVRPHPGTLDIIGVLHSASTNGISRLQYLERAPNGLWSSRRVDRNGTSECAIINRSVDLEYPDDETVVANWAQQRALHTSRWTRWERDDLPGHTNLLNTGQNNPTSLALDDNGEPVTCFFLEAPAIPPLPPQVDLFMRFGNQAPVLVAADQGMPLDPRARGCDVAVAPDGRAGVLWADSTNNRLRYVEFFNGAPGVIEDVKDNGVVVAGNPHLAVAFSSANRPSLVMARLDAGGIARPWVGRKLVNGDWDFDQFSSPAEGGLYPDITFSALSGSWERISMFGKHGGNWRAWFITRNSTGWTAAQAASPPNEGWDTKIATRLNGTAEQLVIAWYDFTGDRARFARLQGGFLGAVADPGPLAGQFVGLDLDAFGQPVFTWRHGPPSAGVVVRTARINPFNSRLPGNQPTPSFERCDLAPGDQGTDLVLDAFDNLRIEHKESEGHNGQEDRLFFLPRP